MVQVWAAYLQLPLATQDAGYGQIHSFLAAYTV